MSIKALNAYKKSSQKQEVLDADPHKLTLMLMQGALDNMAKAKGAIERNVYEDKGLFFSKATSIVAYLRDTLDMSVKSEVIDNLFSLYEYMSDRLTDANIQHSSAIVDEVIALMLPIKLAWAEIPNEAKQVAYEARLAKTGG
jgi:flagellar protein FliS